MYENSEVKLSVPIKKMEFEEVQSFKKMHRQMSIKAFPVESMKKITNGKIK